MIRSEIPPPRSASEWQNHNEEPKPPAGTHRLGPSTHQWWDPLNLRRTPIRSNSPSNLVIPKPNAAEESATARRAQSG